MCHHDMFERPIQNPLQRLAKRGSIIHQKPFDECGRQPPVGPADAKGEPSQRPATGADVERQVAGNEGGTGAVKKYNFVREGETCQENLIEHALPAGFGLVA